MENKNQKVLVTVLLSTLLFLTIIFIGMGYAFFTINNPKGSTAEIISKTGRMVINYDDGTDIIQPVTGIVPSNAIIVNKTFTLTGSNTTVGMKTGDGLIMPYKVGVQYTSGFSDGMLHYYIKEVNRPTNSNVTVNYVITPEPDKTEDDYKNQTVPGNDTYTGYTHGTFKNDKKYKEMVTGEFSASLNDQTITFNLILQFPDNNENQDSEKGKTFNGKVVINREPSFANDSWSEIAANVKDNQAVYKVGDTKQVTIGDKNYTLRVANNTTPAECSGTDFSETACGFVVEFADIVETRQMNSSGTNKGGWPATEMRTYANNDFYNKLPAELRKVIIDTKVISGHGSSDYNANRADDNWESEDKIYLLSAHEVWEDGTSYEVSTYDTAWDNTRQLDYYANLKVTTSNISGAVKEYYRWWLRGAYSDYNEDFLTVEHKGGWYYYTAGTTIIGFAPAFRIG